MRKNSEFWLPGLIKKISLFLFLMTSVVFTTFLIGNFQEFLDLTLLMLLKLFEIFALSFIMTGIYHIILTILTARDRRSRAFLSLGVISAGEIIVIVFYILSNLIFAVTQAVI